MRDTILVVDDEPDVIDLVRYNLHRAGFNVLTAQTGRSALATARDSRPDGIVLDIMLPQMDGLEVFKVLRATKETGDIPILILTAKAQLSERLASLELGVDDYITKPFSPRELVLRLLNVLRRVKGVQTSSTLTVDEFKLDKSNLEFSFAGRRIDLTITEFKLLAMLVERRGKILSRETLLQDVWGYQNAIETRTVDTHVRRLREKLGAAADRIVTIRGEGYRFLIKQTA